jgi:hypothetical protein
VNASEKPRAGVTLSPWPTMMPERMGIIGSTHGVNANNKPMPKNVPSTTNRLPSRIRAASLSCSATGAVVDEFVLMTDGCEGKAVAIVVIGKSSVTVLVIGL